jgi:carbonic anhydrase
LSFKKPPSKKIIPHTLVIGCYECPPSPEQIILPSPGEILQHFEIGALVAPYDSRRSMDPYPLLAKLEYAIEAVKVQHIVVMGNLEAKCLTYLAQGTDYPALADWIEIAHLARERAVRKNGLNNKKDLKKEILQQTVLQSVRNLLTYPIVYKAVKRGELTLNAWYYQPCEDLLFAYNPDTNSYESICPDHCSPYAFSSVTRTPDSEEETIAAG